MLKNTDDSDFYGLKLVAIDRLEPEGISAWFLAVFIFSGVMTVFVALCITENPHITNPAWDTFVQLDVFLLLLHVVISLLYLNSKITYRFQKFQSVWVCYITLKMSIDMYPCFFAIWDDRDAPEYVRDLGIFFLIGGLIYLVFSIVRGVRRVQLGEFRKGGRSLYNFQQSKGFISLPIVYGVTVFAGGLGKFLSSQEGVSARIVELFVILFFAAVLQYAIAMVWPEFLLLAYCKFRFASFTISEPRRGYVRRKSFRESFLFWYNKPLLVLKSRNGWKYKEQAPFWAVIFVWLEVSVIFLLYFYLRYFLDVRGEAITVGQFMGMFGQLAVKAGFFSFFVLMIINMFLKIIMFFKKKIKK